MKRSIYRIVIYIILAGAPLMFGSCVKDISGKILELLDRVTQAEGMVHVTNTTINALYTTVKALEQNIAGKNLRTTASLEVDPVLADAVEQVMAYPRFSPTHAT